MWLKGYYEKYKNDPNARISQKEMWKRQERIAEHDEKIAKGRH